MLPCEFIEPVKHPHTIFFHEGLDVVCCTVQGCVVLLCSVPGDIFCVVLSAGVALTHRAGTARATKVLPYCSSLFLPLIFVSSEGCGSLKVTAAVGATAPLLTGPPDLLQSHASSGMIQSQATNTIGEASASRSCSTQHGGTRAATAVQPLRQCVNTDYSADRGDHGKSLAVK